MLFKCFAGLPKHCRFHMPLFVAVATAVTPISVGNIDIGSITDLHHARAQARSMMVPNFPGIAF